MSAKKRPPVLSDVVAAPVDAPVSLEVSEPPPAATEPEPHRRKRRAVQRSSDLSSAIPSAVFRRLVREITQDFKSDLRWEAEALEALQVDAEAYLMGRFGEANKKREMCESRTLKRAHFVLA
jgi:histone H3